MWARWKEFVFSMKKPCETKEKLLQVGFDLIWDSSYGSVSVDDICKRAGINKGSFYHFFPSKADLAVAAYEEHWKEKRPLMDSIFSPQSPPLERLQNCCREILRGQREKAEKYGHVCGCPYASVGCEIATLDEKIRLKSEQLLNSSKKYIENAIADAIREGSVTVKDPAVAAQRVNSVILGLMVEAKVKNDLKILETMEPTIMGILGVKTVAV
jgi:TetR/AcrR family transcriptional regulator, transcriptional repressor for nem operon